MPHVSSDLKIRAVRHYLRHKNATETSVLFDVPRTSVIRWVQRFRESGSVSRKKRTAEAYKVYESHVTRAKELIRQDPTLTLKMISEKLKQEFDNFSITPQWLGHVLRDNNITRKRTRVHHEPEFRYNRPINIREETQRFYERVRQFPLDKIISIDESSIEPFRSKSYSRCRLGKRCVVTTTDNIVFQKFSLILAVTVNGAEKWRMFDKGSVHAERLEAFLRELLQGKRGYLVLLDNAPVHKKQTVEQLVTASGNTLIYTIPYAPKTNVVEQLFSELKYHLSDSVTRNFTQLQRAIGDIFVNKIPKEHYQNHFTYAYEPIHRERKISTRHRQTPVYKRA